MPVPMSPRMLEILAENHLPAPMLDQFGTMGYLAAGAAQRLGIFDALTQPRDEGDLARSLGTDPRATRVLLDALVATGYVHEEAGSYSCSSSARVWLANGGRESYATVLAFWFDALSQLWGDLERSVRTGRPAHDFYAWLAEDEKRLAGFSQMQDRNAEALAVPVSNLIVQRLRTDRPAILDIGGGWGRHAQALCERLPGAAATVSDLPGTAQEGRRRLVGDPLGDQVTFLPADVLSDPLPGEQDVVLLSNVLHTFAPDDAAGLVIRAAGCLRAGGLLVIVDHLSDRLDDVDPIRTAVARGLDLHLTQTQAGQLPTFDEVVSWLSRAGLGEPELVTLPDFPIDHVLIARVDQ